MDVIKKYDLMGLLKAIEKESNIKILHSVLVGSHATGLNRENSKLDILLIYADNITAYFDTNDHKEIVGFHEGDVGINAFSLKKVIKMIRESNPAIHHILNGKQKIISVPGIVKEMEGFAKTFYSPQRMYLSLSKAAYRNQGILEHSEEKELKIFFAYVRLSLALHQCSCYGMIKQNFNEMVRLSVLSDNSKKCINELVSEYKEGKSHVSKKRIDAVVKEINTLTDKTNFVYSAASVIPDDKLIEFHIRTVLMLSDISKFNI